MKRIIRNRHLTPEEAAAAQAVRAQIAEELPDLIARHEQTESLTAWPMKKPNREVRAILLRLNRVQDLISKANAAYLNDRATDRADIVIPALKEAFDIIVDIRSDYHPVEDKPGKKSNL